MTAMASSHWPAERLAYWYLRLNGFLTTENFIVHPDRRGAQRTDADILAVRFVYHEEGDPPMVGDSTVTASRSFANVIIAEVKTGHCALNGPWTDPEAENMPRVLRAMGCVPGHEVEVASNQLYERGAWLGESAEIRLVALGECRVEDLKIPDAKQLTWREVIDFIVQRSREHGRRKSDVQQWAEDGRQLLDMARQSSHIDEIRAAFGLQRGAGGGRA